MRCATPLSPPQNGNISDHSIPTIPGTQVAFLCDDGLFPEGIMTAHCLDTGKWDKNPGEIVCRNESSKLKPILFCTYHYHSLPVLCVLPAPPLNGTLLNTTYQNTNPTEGSVITFQCDPGFSLVGAATATCNNSGLWDPDTAQLKCKFICVIVCL